MVSQGESNVLVARALYVTTIAPSLRHTGLGSTVGTLEVLDHAINRPEFIAKFPGVKERLERKEISFREAYQELDVSYITLKRALEKASV